MKATRRNSSKNKLLVVEEHPPVDLQELLHKKYSPKTVSRSHPVYYKDDKSSFESSPEHLTGSMISSDTHLMPDKRETPPEKSMITKLDDSPLLEKLKEVKTKKEPDFVKQQLKINIQEEMESMYKESLDKFKTKYDQKLSEAISQHKEIFQVKIDAIKNEHSAEISRYKQIISQLQAENEELRDSFSTKKEKKTNHLLMENMWLKEQVKNMKRNTFNI